MQFPESFVPTAKEVGLLPMMTELLLTAAAFAFLGGFIFFLASRNSVAPRLRASNTLSAVGCLVSGVAYFYLRHYYHELLHQVYFEHDPGSRRQLFHDAFFAINQYRYMAWLVTIPLLFLKPPLVLTVQPREIAKGLGTMVCGAVVWILLLSAASQMIASGDASPLKEWALPVFTFAAWGIAGLNLWLGANRNRLADDTLRRRYLALIGLATVPLVVIQTSFLIGLFAKHTDYNWLHLVYTVIDLVSQLGAGVLVYNLGARELEALVPPESVQKARLVG